MVTIIVIIIIITIIIVTMFIIIIMAVVSVEVKTTRANIALFSSQEVSAQTLAEVTFENFIIIIIIVIIIVIVIINPNFVI